MEGRGNLRAVTRGEPLSGVVKHQALLGTASGRFVDGLLAHGLLEKGHHVSALGNVQWQLQLEAHCSRICAVVQQQSAEKNTPRLKKHYCIQ